MLNNNGENIMEQTNTLDIKYLVTIDNTGMPKAPTLEQLLDKDVRLLYTRDTTKDKEMYLKEVGVIYYLADPNAPTKQQGLSDAECIKRAIENYDLPDNYQPDLLVFKIARRYHDQKITEAGIILENILKAIHNANIAVNILNESLNEKLSSGLSKDDALDVIDIMDRLAKKSIEIPSLVKGLNEAKENLIYEREQTVARGGQVILSSMDADEDE